MTMRTPILLAALLLVAGCTKTTAVDRDGGTSDGAGGTGSGGSSGGGHGGSHGGGGGAGGTGASGGDHDGSISVGGADASLVSADGGIPCGSEVCSAVGCCADPFASLCGVAVGERGCLIPSPESVMADERCPSVDVMGIFTIPSCCTADGQCGIDATNFGGGCVELSIAAEMAAQMGGGFIDWPSPRPCK